MVKIKSFFTRHLIIAVALLENEIKNKLGYSVLLYSNAQGIRNNQISEWKNDLFNGFEEWSDRWKKDLFYEFENTWFDGWKKDLPSKWKNDSMIQDSVNIILRHAPKRNRHVINKYIKELLSGRYNEVNPKLLLYRISNLIKSGKAQSLCDDNKSFIIIGVPHLIFNSNIFNDLKLETINFLVRNIAKHMNGCLLKVRRSHISDITNGCQSDMDKQIIFDDKKTDEPTNGLKLSPSNKFFSTLLQCSVDNLGSGEKTLICVQEQLAKDNLKLSDTCSICFQESVDCGKSNCWLPCFFGNPCGDRCYKCATTSCNKELIQCSGLEDLPGACS
ncbi:hypothetical protein, conserved [Plasmodium gonderi]|uniref:Uncharacterized protein n=1 Tax=Plasmodium gonderi TaxID=77519 RepID=A0A1Y1JQJ3_PLAGO|nr:hypothetical protein, conserved [Plasmodium gonderi]GAW82344.1 hypothetical protein, conserved [Plasmodium gonderi]